MSSSKKMKSGKKERGVMVGGAMMVASKNIVENAVNANNVTTLVAAVKAAGLVETLSSKGPFTVFAPTDDAFKKIPQSTLNDLLKPENKAKLTSILTYHVIAGKLTANKLKNGAKLKTVNGETLTVTRKGNKVMINGVQVMIPNVLSNNGVTHVIGTVLMPQM
ncbi:MAG: fasciclin domain-containing protein [Bacteroidota bacterium]